MLRSLVLGLVISACGSNDGDAFNEPVRVAVAANFAAAHRALEERFERATGIVIETSLGATGQLYAQIKNGAPYHIFLAADDERPRLLEDERLAVAGSRHTYAIGRLVLYAPGWNSPPAGGTALRTRSYAHLAIANPLTAPYGAAAEEVLRTWELLDALDSRIVRGQNVGQTLQFVASGAAEVGFVALSQVVGRNARHHWIVPDTLHRPIVQDAVLLTRGEAHPGARAFLEFLHSDEARRVISSFGYALP